MKPKPIFPRELANRDVDGAVECSEHVDVWRVLHGQRDIPGWLLGDMSADTRSDL